MKNNFEWINHAELRKEVAEKLFSRVDSTGGETACWNWQGVTNADGYGIIKTHNFSWKAHRLSWALMAARVPTDCVLHGCDNRLCVNPLHLREGSRQDNANDMTIRNRFAVGEQNGRAKLTEQEVQEIKACLSAGESQKSVGRKYNTDPCQVRAIRRGDAWKHVI